MAMTIQNNSGTMMALGQLKKNDSSLSKQLKKVSSGMRLNDASDDASGYSISERMRTMIRALGQDIQNAKNGKDLVAVAEGGIQEIIDNLRSMKEMAINSANDHNTDLDRETLEKEFASRKEAITDITASTNYNGRLLLTGDYAQYHTDRLGDVTGIGNGNSTSQTTLISGFQPAFGTSRPDGRTISGGHYPVDSSFSNIPLPIWNYWIATGQSRPSSSGQYSQFAVSMDFSNLNISYPKDLDGKGFSILCSGCSQYIDIKFDASTTNTTYDPSPAPPPGEPANSLARAFVIGVQNVTSPAGLAQAIFDGIYSVQNRVSNAHNVDLTSTNVQIDPTHNVRLANINGNYYFLKKTNEPSFQFINGLYGGPKNEFNTDNMNAGSSMNLGNPLIIHTGSKENQHLRVFINAMWPKNMGIEDTHVTPKETALMAMRLLDNAMDYALNEITRMGAYQMRLGQTEDNLVTGEENTQAAESTIRDADMAKEMTGYTKASILSQSAQAMLAQSNQNSSNVLSLLQ